MSASTASSAAPKSAGRKAKAAAPVAAAAPAPVVVAAPAPAPAPAPVAAPAVVEHVVATTVAPVEEVNLAARVSALAEKVNGLRTAMSSIYTEVKTLEKAVPRALKNAQKGRKGRKAAAVEGDDSKPKKPTIFKIPTQISDALCTFLGVAKGTLVSRSEVTSRICKYAKDKGLMEKQNIKHDAALRKLLALKESDDLKILNLQRYLAPHYPATAAKAAAKAAAAATAAAATKTA